MAFGAGITVIVRRYPTTYIFLALRFLGYYSNLFGQFLHSIKLFTNFNAKS